MLVTAHCIMALKDTGGQNLEEFIWPPLVGGTRVTHSTLGQWPTVWLATWLGTLREQYCAVGDKKFWMRGVKTAQSVETYVSFMNIHRVSVAEGALENQVELFVSQVPL
jgi:hypothetical protein